MYSSSDFQKNIIEPLSTILEEAQMVYEFMDYYERTPKTEKIINSFFAFDSVFSDSSKKICLLRKKYYSLIKDEVLESFIVDNKFSRKVRLINDALFLLNNLNEKPNLIKML